MSVLLNDYTEIENILEDAGARKIFLCCGKSFQKTKLFEYICHYYDVVVFDHIRPNPRFEDMVTGAELLKKEQCDFMIAAGGGSPMDSAKMIRLMATNDTATALIQPMENNEIRSLFIPTTSGSGSEATKSSVFYLNENEKFSIANDDFIPDYVLLDETLLETVPEYQRKCTCLDALCHSIESFWNKKATEESRGYAAESIRLFFENKDRYMKNETVGNRGMLMASFYAGKAINITGTTAPHAMCYNITMHCRTAHGHSVAVCLSKIWEYMLAQPMSDDVRETLTVLSERMGGKTAKDGLYIFNALLKEFDLGFPKAEESILDGFVSKVNVSRLGNHPTPLTAEDVKEIYRRVLCE